MVCWILLLDKLDTYGIVRSWFMGLFHFFAMGAFQ